MCVCYDERVVLECMHVIFSLLLLLPLLVLILIPRPLQKVLVVTCLCMSSFNISCSLNV